MNLERSQVVSTSSNNRLGRTAWMVMIVGLLTSVAMIFGVTVSHDPRSGSQDLMSILGMGLTIGIVSYCWAVVLAVRAWWQQESATLPIWLINFATIPPALYGVAHWFYFSGHLLVDQLLINVQWVYGLELPIVLPFFSLALLSGTLIVRRIVPSKPALRRALFFTAYVLLLGLLTLPVPFCMQSYFSEIPSSRSKWIGEHAPVLVRDMAEYGLSCGASEIWKKAQLTAIEKGHLSLERLKRRCHDADEQISITALFEVSKLDPGWATDEALQRLKSFNYGSEYAVRIIARCGNDAQRREYVESKTVNGGSLQFEFYDELQNARPDLQLIPIFKQKLKSGSNDIDAILPLCSWLPVTDSFITETLYADKQRSKDVIDQTLPSMRLESWGRVVLILLDHPDSSVRRQLLYAIHSKGAHFQFSTSPEHILLRKPLIQRLLKMLIYYEEKLQLSKSFSCDDWICQRDVASFLAELLSPDDQTLIVLNAANGNVDNLGSPKEPQSIRTIREHAERWLREHAEKAWSKKSLSTG